MSTYEITEATIALSPRTFEFGEASDRRKGTSVWIQPDGADALKAAAFGIVGEKLATLKPGTRARMVIKFDQRVSVIDGRKIAEDRAMIDDFEIVGK